MQPFIYSGDLIKIKESNHYKTGDIVVFYDKNQELICHRIINIDPLITKGDYAKPCEFPQIKQVIGKLESIEREQKKYKLNSSLNQVLVWLSKMGAKIPYSLRFIHLLNKFVFKPIYIVENRSS